MKRYRPSSELQRAAELAVRNGESLAAWRKRYAEHMAKTARRDANINRAAILADATKEAT